MSWWVVAAVAIAAVVVSAGGGWALTAGVLRLAARSSDAGTETGSGGGSEAGDGAGNDSAATSGEGDGTGDAGDGPMGPRARAVLRGGTWIGLLERVAVTGALLVGYPAGIAFVVAVKGLGRYPELREHPGSSERFVIGTLASLIWATAIGAVGRAIIGG